MNIFAMISLSNFLQKNTQISTIIELTQVLAAVIQEYIDA